MSFSALLARRGGIRFALLAVPLHAVRHLGAVLSVPAGVLLWARSAPR